MGNQQPYLFVCDKCGDTFEKNLYIVTNEKIYKDGVEDGFEPYLDEKGNCKFECIVNDSQIPGIPLPGTYQYGRPVTVLNKEDFE